MQKNRNALKRVFVAAATGAALLALAVPAGATPSAGAAVVDLPCGLSGTGDPKYYRNCEDHAVKIWFQYYEGISSWACVPAGGTETLYQVSLAAKSADHC
ncbi:hypothetical protein ACFVVX_27125 [Kitasatospora sp. NPDC058170]|uniref:hypothetical protein n=1 Tax=Kitasatospora sp. NPDC058170 TaxID=3346364 RepID=UPI0036DB3991